MTMTGGSPKANKTVSTSHSPAPSPLSGALNFLSLCGSLKHLRRRGWIRAGVHDPESDSDHMFRCALIAMVAAPVGLDREKCIKMALIHDVPEALAGDITPHDKITPEAKQLKEKNALFEMTRMLGENTPICKEMRDLWLEFEEGLTEEAKFVKDIDKFEMVLQAKEYSLMEENKTLVNQLGQFFTSTRGIFKTETIQELDRLVVHEDLLTPKK